MTLCHNYSQFEVGLDPYIGLVLLWVVRRPPETKKDTYMFILVYSLSTCATILCLIKVILSKIGVLQAAQELSRALNRVHYRSREHR